MKFTRYSQIDSSDPVIIGLNVSGLSNYGMLDSVI
jgi:hypothetical protein